MADAANGGVRHEGTSLTRHRPANKKPRHKAGVL
jgi:hypothetical protein